MVVFAHFKQKNLKDFSKKLLIYHDEYKQRSFDFDIHIKEFFQELQDFFQQIGNSKHEIQISQLSVYYETAAKGIHPLHLEKLKTGRRENTWIAAFHCLSILSEILQQTLEDVNNTIDEAKEMLSQLIISAIQNQLLTQNHLNQVGDLGKIEQIWNDLKQHLQISLVDKKLRLSITNNDIYILIDEIFSSIK